MQVLGQPPKGRARGKELGLPRRTRNPVDPPDTLLHDARGQAPAIPRDPGARIARRPGVAAGAGGATPATRAAVARIPGAASPHPGPPAPAHPREQDLVLGRYRLLEHLGSGGFGEVWRAHDELLDRQVAVKRLRSDPGTEPARAKREAQACARLAHPAIVALYEAGSDDHAYYLISEF